MDKLALAVPLVLMPALLGGSRPWLQSFVAGCSCLLLIPVFWKRSIDLKPQLQLSALIVCVFIASALVQILPMPLSWIRALSPERFFWLQQSIMATELVAPSWPSLSYTPLSSAYQLAWWIFLGLFAASFSRILGDRDLSSWLCGLLMLVAILEAFYGLLQSMVPTMNALWTESDAYRGCARGTYVNRNHYAAFLTMLWPLLLAWVLTMPRTRPRNTGKHRDAADPQAVRHKQLFFGFLLGLMLLAIAASRSRAGLACTLVAATVFIVLSRLKRTEALLFLGGSWGIACLYGWALGLDEVFGRFNSLIVHGSDRLRIWKDTLQMVADHQLTGIGLGGHLTVFQRYQTHLPEDSWICQVHNDYLQLLAELGLPIASLIICLGWLFWMKQARAVHGLNKQNRGQEGLLAAGALAGAAGFLLHCLVEFNWQIPANQLYCVLLLVLAKRLITEARLKQKPPPRDVPGREDPILGTSRLSHGDGPTRASDMDRRNDQ
jgi:O-antigen ligase